MKPWVADARDIGQFKGDDLVITPSIKNFIDFDERDNMYFAVAPKGVGKTLFLMYKRQLYQAKHKRGLYQEDIYFIPKDNLVDRNVGSISFSDEKIDLFRHSETWKNIWSFCISLSIIKNFKRILQDDNKKRRDELNRLIGLLPGEMQVMIDNPLLVTPYGYLNDIMGLSYKKIPKIIKNQYLLTEIIKKVRSGVAVFIDNADECFAEHLKESECAEHLKESGRRGFSGELSSEVWYGAQIGLMLAIRELIGLNSHLKIFASIRKEAFQKLLQTEDSGLQVKGDTLDIEYSKPQLKEIFIKNIKSMGKGDLVNSVDIETKPIYSFLGLEENKITNTQVGNKKEDIFDYIYRHTLKRPRDLMIIGAELTKITAKDRTEKTIRTKIYKAATDIACTYIEEMKPHLDFNHFNQFEELFDLIHSNILSEKEIKEICRVLNKQESCENKNCKHCEKTHAFCNLYKIGLLGAVLNDPLTGELVQTFLGPGEKVFESKILPYSKFYLIHPILNSLICERSTLGDKTTYYINPRIIVGDGYGWADPRIYRTARYGSFINRVCNTDRFVNKRGVFLASSYNKKEVIEELDKELKKLNLSLESDKWMEREEPGTGRIFCDEVCPKVFRNFWMLAEVSDFNPNVFFECGFAMGLGREVIFLCDEKANLIKSKLGEQLYYSYETVDDIITKLEWTQDMFSNIEINGLYKKPRVFRDINKFDSPEDREKTGDVFVLSFNQETDVIRKLSKYGCRIVEVNRLNQSFIPKDLVEEVIDARSVLVNLSGVQKEPTINKLNDSQLMCLAGICVSQGVPVKIFQSNDHFYSDLRGISIVDNSGEYIIEYINGLSV